jgi:CheY-like chemotaxis protein
MTRVLVVDDEPAMRLTVGANLELEGFDVVSAASGAEALKLASEGHFDLVLTDVRMPGMNGVELFRELRKRHTELPVLLMTAFAAEGLVEQALGEGVFTLLPKPFSIDTLVAALTTARQAPLVLIVDDAPPVAETTAAALRELGVRAEAVTTGPEAIEVVQQGKVDVCVVDMVMPGMNGSEVIERLHAVAPKVVCLAMSGQSVPEMFRRVAAHVQRFFTKPVEPRDLAVAIARARGPGKR